MLVTGATSAVARTQGTELGVWVSGRGSSEDAPDGGRPPLATAVRGRDSVVGKRPGDLAEASAGLEFAPDPLDGRRGEGRRPADGPTPSRTPCALEIVLNEPLELADRDEPLTPGCLHGLNGGHEPPVDRRDADAEHLCGLSAAVGQRPHLSGIPELACGSRRDATPIALPLAAASPARTHLAIIH